MKRNTTRLPNRATLLAGLYFGTALIATVPDALSQNFYVSIEKPGVENQESPLVVRGADVWCTRRTCGGL